MESELIALGNEYISYEKNNDNINLIKGLLAQKDYKELSALLSTRLTFGTAGLRAKMGPGYSQMNELTIIQASQGLCSFMLSDLPDFKERGIVIGYDHRHNSETFARLTAACFLAKNVKVYLYSKLVHTPMVPFAIGEFNAGCGVMITASHNPKQDNGYKVYASNGCQIISPMDKQISKHISENLVPKTWDYNLYSTSPLCFDPFKELEAKYFKSLERFRKFGDVGQSVKFCYTPMHGVGLSFAQKAFETFQLAPFIQVVEQALPDPDFPTVSFPNPEENGALDLAIETATKQGASIVLANDPDADRFAVAEFQQRTGKWHVFTGNQIGIILASFVIESYRNKNGKLDPSLYLLTTTVSSHMLQELAKVENIGFDETLTVGNRAIDLNNDGNNPVFAFEEAIGFMCHDLVRDKDGISALAIFSEWANYLYSKKSTVYEHLQFLYEKYGYFVSNNGYLVCHDKELINSAFDKIRYEKGSSNIDYPKSIAGHKVTSIRDLTIGYDSETADNKPRLPTSASSQMITFKLENGCLITLRTSGTEPKIKYYTELKAGSFELGEQCLKDIVEAVVDLLQKALSV